MRGLFLALLTLLAIASSPGRAQDAADPLTMPLAELERIAPTEHPSAYFVLASRTFAASARDEAVRWLYVGQIRYRFHIAANPGLRQDGDPALLALLLHTIGKPINEWAGGDVDGWIGSMRAALDWDAATPNGFTSKEKHAAELRTVQNGLDGLVISIAARRSEIPAERARNGLENRAP
ncbi:MULTISPECIES: hypothetical protein [Methylorubrum]|uniref:hypothetical protein n=1 Tax=Methylorubrum TaxID=2282523 RepID=UPI0020A12B90|nr:MULTISPECIES: hypothetical protein [Methylorubrum]MCP1547260.1 hypothetical protein [Methylorubrum zatmanii]MCP1556124.1 hypothetical protein [Methylorubrum extorquens]MCP1577563.1 hypothetical protein [Methylorubrum extorquens]